ncbi:MAG: aldo/keto reductase [Cycloclasticus sp. symbiont of Bathymodiolus heckerae]|nr:MAG: aldo/keto reductase [Cycloclasticus sp. symbiont of Bathymodiolus heckerae]
MKHKIALGSAQFGLTYGISNKIGQVHEDEVQEILALAKKNQVHTLDTAIAYGDSEKVLGTVGVDDWEIISKLSALPHGVTDVDEWLESEVINSCRRLKIESLHGVLLHRPADLLGKHGTELQDALYRVKKEGLVDKIGISVYEPSELDQFFDLMKFDIVQAPFSLVDRRMQESGWLKRLQDTGCEFHARSVFLQGLLLMTQEQRPSQFDRWRPVWQQLDSWLKEADVTAVQACLGYVLSIEEVTKVVLGVESRAQLEEIFTALTTSLQSVPAGLSVSDKELLNPALWDDK